MWGAVSSHTRLFTLCASLALQSHMHSFVTSCFATILGSQTAAGRDLLAESACDISLTTAGAHPGSAACCQTHAAATLFGWQMMYDTV